MPEPRRRTYTYKQRRAKIPSGHRRLRKEARSGLRADLDDAIGQLHARVREIAAKYKRDTRWVRSQLFGGGKSARFVRRERKLRLYDAYVHVMAKVWNKDRSIGNKLSLREIKAKIARDRTNYYTKRPLEEQQAWLAEYKADKEAAAREPRINRKGEQQDAASTLKRVARDLDTLRTRTGVRSLIIAVRPEVLFTMDPFVFYDKHTEEFFSLALGKTPEQVARMLEMSTVNGLSSLTAPAPKNAAELRKNLRMRLQQGLDVIIALRFPNEDPPHVQMNYESYDYEIVYRYRVRLVGWTFNGGTLLNPGKMTMPDARELYEGLVKKTVYWELVPETETVNSEKRKRAERSDAGEKRGPQKKRRTDAGAAAAKKGGTAKKGSAAKKGSGAKSKATVSSSSSSSSSSEDESE